MNTSSRTALLATFAVATMGVRPAPVPWGAVGHELATRAAVEGLPEEMPAFFRERADQLAYLGPEPDRWRDGGLPEMDEAFKYDHYIDLERISTVALEAEDRWEFYRVVYDSGLESPESDVGFLPFHIVELYQRLLVEWRLWHRATDPSERRWIEDRIVDDAGILGHYVADASQPHHTTIHFNGWAAAAPNPEGFTRDRSFHSRFESDFVNARVTAPDLAPGLASRPLRELEDVRAAVVEHILESHGQVMTLYRLDRDVGFDPARPDSTTRAFAGDRLASGAAMLRDLWWTAWRSSR
ncbi:MAG TPA: hypothetical protein VGA70_00855 [Longimicrobiales bacterium]